MKSPAEPLEIKTSEDRDLALATQAASQAISADDRNSAKFFYGLARFYWARCNSSE